VSRTRHGWRNWAGNQTCSPAATAHPATDAELAAIIKQAAARGQPVKVVGAGHSFTDVACTDGLRICMDE
jgi:L-gulono-1,4-lactone dehydrogenase